jgi:hypothetical protein
VHGEWAHEGPAPHRCRGRVCEAARTAGVTGAASGGIDRCEGNVAAGGGDVGAAEGQRDAARVGRLAVGDACKLLGAIDVRGAAAAVDASVRALHMCLKISRMYKPVCVLFTFVTRSSSCGHPSTPPRAFVGLRLVMPASSLGPSTFVGPPRL